MNRTRTFHLSWTLPVTIFASIVLSAGAFSPWPNDCLPGAELGADHHGERTDG